MKQISEIIQNREKSENYETRVFYDLLTAWNLERKRNGFKPLTRSRYASAINRNPFLKGKPGELDYILKTCRENGNFKYAHWVLFK